MKVKKCVCMLRFLSEMCAPPAAASRVGPVEGPGAAGTLWASDSRWAALVRGDGPSVADRSSWEISQEDTSGRSSKAPDGLNHQDMHLVFLLIKSPHIWCFITPASTNDYLSPQRENNPQVLAQACGLNRGYFERYSSCRCMRFQWCGAVRFNGGVMNVTDSKWKSVKIH